MKAPSEIAKQVTIRSCSSHADLKMCVDLQRHIWNFSDEDIVPPALFVVAQHTGGHAYCAFRDNQAVGFALAFSAERDGRRFWHSHMVGVLPDYQNAGIGMLLKLHQRDEALRLGIPLIEWTFDPLELRNAYFNIARLGVVIRHYIADCYGETSSPLHGTLPTDRLVAEWHLQSARVRAALAGTATTQPGPTAVRVAVPTEIRELRIRDARRTREIQAGLRDTLKSLFSRSYAVTGFRRGAENCEYLLESYED